MTRWAILVMPPAQGMERDRVFRLAEIEGTREEAEAALWHQVQQYRPNRPLTPRSSTLYRVPEGWLLLLQGAVGRLYPHRFVLAEEQWDSRR